MTGFAAVQKKYWHDQSQLARRDPLHPVIRAYVEPKLEFICQHISLPKNARILDVGAGNGYFSFHWKKYGDTLATDYSDVMLKKNPIEKKQRMDARHLTFDNSSFDIVFCHALLHHIEKNDRLMVVREMKRVSRRFVAIIEPNRNNPLMTAFGLLKKEERGLLCFSPRYVRGLAEQAGLRVIQSCTWGTLTPNRMPFANLLLPFFKILERQLPLGITTIVVAEK